MRALLLLCVAVCSLGMSGCGEVCSVNPLAKSEDAVDQPALVGKWVTGKSDDPDFCIERSDHQGLYNLVIFDPESKNAQLYLVRLVNLEDRLFMDIVFNKQVVGNTEASNPLGTIPHHVIVKVEISGNDLSYAPMDPDKVLKENERDYYPINHLMIDDLMLLTASTEDLRQYISKHVDDVFSDSEYLTRKPESDATGKPCWAFNAPTNP